MFTIPVVKITLELNECASKVSRGFTQEDKIWLAVHETKKCEWSPKKATEDLLVNKVMMTVL